MNRVNWPILGIGVAVTAVLVLILNSGFGVDPKALPDALTGKDAPTFKLVDLNGKEWSQKELEGRPVFVNFWSTWCGPCKMEHPMLLQAARRYPDVQFVGIIYSDDNNKVRFQMRSPPYDQLMDALVTSGVAYPNLDDSTGLAALDYGVGGVPESFFIDRSGRITHKEVGPLTAQKLTEQLDRIMAK
ncbi:MAG: redoxin family protein [Myxococcota bacterium]